MIIAFYLIGEEVEFSIKLWSISIVLILATALYAAGTLDKTPLVKYQFIRRMCGVLRFIGRKGRTPTAL